jgi:CubicO group peptidase (beta-lactamase class C family)
LLEAQGGGVTSPAVGGDVDGGFERVADAFRENFAVHGDLGAAFSAYVGQDKVVDLWGGIADRNAGATWKEDTLQVVFSGTKGLTAGCILLLIDEGALDLDCLVADYWPEFQVAGKSAITVAELVSHRAGLPAITTSLELDELVDARRMAELLATQEPHRYGPGQVAYHALTFGWLCDALVRRASGMSIGDFFAARIAGPLGLEAWIGLPDELLPRVSKLALDTFAVAEPLTDNTYARMIYGNPPTFEDPLAWNTDEYHRAEIPAAGGIATARAMAKYYACLANGGRFADTRIWSSDAIVIAQRALCDGRDPYSGDWCRYSTGFELQKGEHMFLGPIWNAFGHPGAGGSTHGAWPDAGVGFSYCMNLMREDADARGRRVLSALAEALELS